jgi:hypothetical protein
VERRTRRRLSGMLLAFALAPAGVIGLARGSVGPAEQRGLYALLGGRPRIVSEFWAVHGAGLTATLKIRQFQVDGTTPIRNYDVDMQRLMHLIIVRDDFSTFAHLHPSFDTTTGTFANSFTKAPNHRYFVYADTTPRGLGQQVFRFTIESDGALAASPKTFTASPASVTVAPYTLRLTSTTLTANQRQSVSLTVLKAGQPARDLGTYLGAAAHAVLINTSTLAYVHVHPVVRGAGDVAMGTQMNMATSAQAGPAMQMDLPALPAGTYKAWIQFRGANDVVYTAPFTIRAR